MATIHRITDRVILVEYNTIDKVEIAIVDELSGDEIELLDPGVGKLLLTLTGIINEKS